MLLMIVMMVLLVKMGVIMNHLDLRIWREMLQQPKDYCQCSAQCVLVSFGGNDRVASSPSRKCLRTSSHEFRHVPNVSSSMCAGYRCDSL